MAIEDVRPPPCLRCGLVETARQVKRHRCNPAHVLMMQVGADHATRIGRAIVDAFGVFAGY